MLCDVDFSDAKIHLKNKEMDLCFGTNRILTDKVRTGEIMKGEFYGFTAGCFESLESLTSKFVERFIKIC